MTPTEWKTQVAVELLDSLSENRLARVICSQVCFTCYNLVCFFCEYHVYAVIESLFLLNIVS